MYKELMISIVIIIAIIIGNIVTQGYTRKTVEVTNQELGKLREQLMKEENEIEEEEIKKNAEGIHEEWQKRYKTLAYFIEHDELEKVETQLTSIKANIEVKEYEQTIPELDKCTYLLNHVKDKEALMIQNIF